MKIYISGPMRKRPEFNFPAFLAAADRLRTQYPEAELFSPAQKDIDSGFNYHGLTGHEDLKYELGFDLRESLAIDMEYIAKHATHIYMLEGWSGSSGARAELALAEALGLDVLFESRLAALEEPEAVEDARSDGYNDGYSDGTAHAWCEDNYDEGYAEGYDAGVLDGESRSE